jgi:hypothetical protein
MSQQQNEVSITIPTKDVPKTKQKKKYDITDDLLEGSYIDAKDSVQSWCLAQIIERCDSDSTIKINFDGWSHKWDEVVALKIFITLSGTDLIRRRLHLSENTLQVRKILR